MLVELHVRDLGVISEASTVLGPGMTALTGETGAGKTLVVTAIELLAGGRADPAVVRTGATQAEVQGRFVTMADGVETEVVLARTIPAKGRSRSSIDGRLCTLAELAEHGGRLLELHGQNTHQSLLSASSQRQALDGYGDIDHGPLLDAEGEVTRLAAELATLGGDERERVRQRDLLRYQVAEIDEAGLEDPDEDEVLARREELLATAAAQREAAERAQATLAEEGGGLDRVAAAASVLRGAPSLGQLAARLDACTAELAELASDIRRSAEAIEEDPDALAALQQRRRRLAELKRKYGQSLAEVMSHGLSARHQLAELTEREARARQLAGELEIAQARLTAAAEAVTRARRAAAPSLARAVEANLSHLAMDRARFEVRVGGPGGGGDQAGAVEFLLTSNPGAPPLPLAKVASGGELARIMLALRVATSEAHRDHPQPATQIFDEVDAGIGGETALSVGRFLARLGEPSPAGSHHQVLVVTHLAQVAAFAHHHLRVTKTPDSATTVSTVSQVEGDQRLVELSRMLSGQPDRTEAHSHAATLLELAISQRDLA